MSTQHEGLALVQTPVLGVCGGGGEGGGDGEAPGGRRGHGCCSRGAEAVEEVPWAAGAGRAAAAVEEVRSSRPGRRGRPGAAVEEKAKRKLTRRPLWCAGLGRACVESIVIQVNGNN